MTGYAPERVEAPLRSPDGKFQPGSVLNPGGRPTAEFSLTALLRQKVAEHPEIVDALITRAQTNQQAAEYVFDRLEGKPVQMQMNVNVSATWEAALQAFSGLTPADQLPAPEPTPQGA